MTTSHRPLEIAVAGIREELNEVLLHQLGAFREGVKIVTEAVHQLFDVLLEAKTIFLCGLAPLFSNDGLILLIGHNLVIHVADVGEFVLVLLVGDLVF